MYLKIRLYDAEGNAQSLFYWVRNWRRFYDFYHQALFNNNFAPFFETLPRAAHGSFDEAMFVRQFFGSVNSTIIDWSNVKEIYVTLRDEDYNIVLQERGSIVINTASFKLLEAEIF